MEAVITKEENVLTVAPRGRLDTVNSASLKENIDKYEAHFGEIKPRQINNPNNGIMDFPLPKGQA